MDPEFEEAALDIRVIVQGAMKAIEELDAVTEAVIASGVAAEKASKVAVAAMRRSAAARKLDAAEARRDAKAQIDTDLKRKASAEKSARDQIASDDRVATSATRRAGIQQESAARVTKTVRASNNAQELSSARLTGVLDRNALAQQRAALASDTAIMKSQKRRWKSSGDTMYRHLPVVGLMTKAYKVLRLAVLGVGAAAVVAAVKLVEVGLKYNNFKTNQEIAFKQYMGSAKGSRAEFDAIFQMTRHTPLRISNTAQAELRLQSVEVDSKASPKKRKQQVAQSNRDLQTIIDMNSAVGGNDETFLRLSHAASTLQVGPALKRSMNMFMRAGLPSAQLLDGMPLPAATIAKDMKSKTLTQEQKDAIKKNPTFSKDDYANLGRMAIPGKYVWRYLAKQADERYAGIAFQHSQTPGGRRSTLLDDMRQFSGTATQGLFGKGGKLLNWADPIVEGLDQAIAPKTYRGTHKGKFHRANAAATRHNAGDEAMQSGSPLTPYTKASKFDTIALGFDKAFGDAHPGGYKVLTILHHLEKAFHNIVTIVKQSVIPAFKTMFDHLGGADKLKLLEDALAWMVKHKTATKDALIAIAAGYAAINTAQFMDKTAGKVLKVGGMLQNPGKNTNVGKLVKNIFGKNDVKVAKDMAGAQKVLAASTLEVTAATEAETVAQGELDVAMDSNPIGLIIIGIAALAVGFYELWKHCKLFRDIVKGTLNWLLRHWKLVVAAIPVLGLMIVLVITHFKFFKKIAVAAIHAIIGVVKALWNDWLKPMGTWIGKHASGMWDGLKGGLDGVVSWIKQKLGSIIEAVVSMWNHMADLPGAGHVGVHHITWGGFGSDASEDSGGGLPEGALPGGHQYRTGNDTHLNPAGTQDVVGGGPRRPVVGTGTIPRPPRVPSGHPHRAATTPTPTFFNTRGGDTGRAIPPIHVHVNVNSREVGLATIDAKAQAIARGATP